VVPAYLLCLRLHHATLVHVLSTAHLLAGRLGDRAQSHAVAVLQLAHAPRLLLRLTVVPAYLLCLRLIRVMPDRAHALRMLIALTNAACMAMVTMSASALCALDRSLTAVHVRPTLIVLVVTVVEVTACVAQRATTHQTVLVKVTPIATATCVTVTRSVSRVFFAASSRCKPTICVNCGILCCMW
jgi:hypothetical protein